MTKETELFLKKLGLFAVGLFSAGAGVFGMVTGYFRASGEHGVGTVVVNGTPARVAGVILFVAGVTIILVVVKYWKWKPEDSKDES